MVKYSGVIQLIVTQFLKFKKGIVRIIIKVGNRDSCHPLFKALNILPFYSQYQISMAFTLDRI
jgi:hypothetical protein